MNLNLDIINTNILSKLFEITEIDPNKITYYGEPLLHYFCGCNDSTIVKFLLEHPRIDPMIDGRVGNSILHSVCQSNNIELVRIFLEDNRIDPNAKNMNNMTPFHIVCQLGNIDIVRLFLEDERIELNKYNDTDNSDHSNRDELMTPIMYACREYRTDVVKILLEDYRICLYDTNSNESLFQYACRYAKNDTDIVRLLLSSDRLDPNIKNERNQTPIMVAPLWNNSVIIKILLNDDRTDFTVKDKNGLTFFHYVCYSDLPSILEILLADERFNDYLMMETNDGSIPLHVACNSGENTMEICKLLMNDDRIDINKTNNVGRTPLECACISDNISVIPLFLKNSKTNIEALLKFIDNNGCDRKIKDLIRKYGKKN